MLGGSSRGPASPGRTQQDGWEGGVGGYPPWALGNRTGQDWSTNDFTADTPFYSFRIWTMRLDHLLKTSLFFFKKKW